MTKEISIQDIQNTLQNYIDNYYEIIMRNNENIETLGVSISDKFISLNIKFKNTDDYIRLDFYPTNTIMKIMVKKVEGLKFEYSKSVVFKRNFNLKENPVEFIEMVSDLNYNIKEGLII